MIAVLLALLLAPVFPEPEPYQTFVPMVVTPCARSDRRGWTIAYPFKMAENYPGNAWSLCEYELDNTHSWLLTYDAYPMVWSGLNAEYFKDYCHHWQGERVLFGNECDRPDQCNEPPVYTAAWLVDLQASCPNITWVGPMYSVLDDGTTSREWWDYYIGFGGDPDAIIPSMHIYPGFGLSGSLTARLGQYYDNYMIPTGQGRKRVSVTEVGWRDCFPDGPETFRRWLQALWRDWRVDEFFVFSDYWQDPEQPEKPCDFTPLLDWTSGHNRTWLGDAYINPWRTR